MYLNVDKEKALYALQKRKENTKLLIELCDEVLESYDKFKHYQELSKRICKFIKNSYLYTDYTPRLVVHLENRLYKDEYFDESDLTLYIKEIKDIKEHTEKRKEGLVESMKQINDNIKNIDAILSDLTKLETEYKRLDNICHYSLKEYTNLNR